MTVAEKIARRIDRMPEGSTFRYQRLGIDRDEYGAAAKAIERLIKKGRISRASTGVFYKPKRSAFGALRPSEEELLKPYLFDGGQRIAYVTGGSLYHRMGLTTQVPKTLQVASRTKRVSTKIGTTRVKPVKSYVEVTKDNYPLLEILDALKDFRKIPDLDQASALALLKDRIVPLSDGDRTGLITCALAYPPRAIALLGALLEHSGIRNGLERLRARLNPLTTYRLVIGQDLLPTAASWHIH
jgi:hypothetical protein